jgi:uncharacterized membrane protein YozB (DUF420 family)
MEMYPRGHPSARHSKVDWSDMREVRTIVLLYYCTIVPPVSDRWGSARDDFQMHVRSMCSAWVYVCLFVCMYVRVSYVCLSMKEWLFGSLVKHIYSSMTVCATLKN